MRAVNYGCRYVSPSTKQSSSQLESQTTQTIRYTTATPQPNWKAAPSYLNRLTTGIEAQCWSAWLSSGVSLQIELIMCQGDVLYMPRGTIHAGNTTGIVLVSHKPWFRRQSLCSSHIWIWCWFYMEGFYQSSCTCKCYSAFRDAYAVPGSERTESVGTTSSHVFGVSIIINEQYQHQVVCTVLGNAQVFALVWLTWCRWSNECLTLMQHLTDCDECIHKTLWLMRRVQLAARSKRIDPWTNESVWRIKTCSKLSGDTHSQTCKDCYQSITKCIILEQRVHRYMQL